MTYLLARGTQQEKDEALSILSEEAVPDRPPGDDYDSLQSALGTTLGQMLHLRAYDDAVRLFVSRLHLLFGAAENDALGLFVTIAEILAKASEDARELFRAQTGLSWTEWLEGVFFDFFRLRKEEHGILLLQIALHQRNCALAEFMAKHMLRRGAPERTLPLLASVFEATGLFYERALCMARFHLLQESYEEAIAETEWLLERQVDPEVRALYARSLLGFSRVARDYLYGRTIAANHLDKCLDVLATLVSSDEARAHVQELMLEALCLKGDFAQVEQRVQEWAIVSSRWRVQALLARRISSRTPSSQVFALLAEVSMVEPIEELEACRAVNLWLEEVRPSAAEVWSSRDTLGLLTGLRAQWADLPDRLNTYEGFWLVGLLAFYEGVWRTDQKDGDAVPCLWNAVSLWRQALERTRRSEAPYESLLRRHECLARETTEEALRRCLKRIRALEEEQARAAAA